MSRLIDGNEQRGWISDILDQITTDDVVIPTDEQIRNTPAPWFDHDRAKFREAIREAIAEKERQARQATFVEQWEASRYGRRPSRPYTVIKDGKEYFFEG